MKIIALDSSGLVASCAILEDEILVAEYTTDFKKTHSQTLLPMLDAISKMTELDKSTVDAVAVSSGPGSFTGLRIGSATAKGIALALGIPIVEVPTLAGLAFNLYGSGDVLCPIMDARRAQVYNGIYHFEGNELLTDTDQRAIGVKELADELNGLPLRADQRVILLGDGVSVYRAMLEELLKVPHEYAPAHVNRQRAASVGALGERFFRDGKAIPAERHVPVYLRKSQAEREREEQERQKKRGSGRQEDEITNDKGTE